MPPKSSRGRRKDRRVNVFVQENQPKPGDELDDEPLAVAEDAAPEAVAGAASARGRRIRAQRASRQARVRSEVFTRTLGKELRKVGILTVGIGIALTVLTFTVN